MRIVFVCDTMDSGGAERVISSLANSFNEFGHEVFIIMLAKRANGSFYELSDSVRLIGLTSDLQKDLPFLKKAKLLKTQIKGIKPNVVVSFLSYVCIYTWWALRHSNIPYIVSERNDPHSRGKIKQFLLNMAFRKSSGCVFQTEDAKNWYKNICGDKSIVIYNPVNLTFITNQCPIPKKQVLYVGRYSEQKNCQLLIRAFLKFHEKHPDYYLVMYGDGIFEVELNDLIKESKAEGYVKIKKSSKTWQEDEFDSSLFVLPSRYEGMPNVLAEALCLGIPSISTDCPIGGPKELKIIFPEQLLLCENENLDSMASTMEKALLIKRQKPYIPKELDKTYIANKWLDFIRGAINK